MIINSPRNGKAGTRNFKYCVSLLASEWSDNQQVIRHPNIVKDNCHYVVSPATESLEAYGKYQVLAQGVTTNGEMTFRCSAAPDSDLKVNIIQMELGTGSDGMPPRNITIGANGNWFIGETDTGVKAKGTDGKAPVKGEDYFTEADKAELVDAVIAALPTAEGGSF